MAGSPQKTRGVPTNRAKPGATLRRCSAGAAERRRDSSRKNTRDGAAVLRGREERFLPTRPGAQTTRARKNRAAPLGMTGWSGARDAQPLQAGLNCDAPPGLQSGWRDELAATEDAERFLSSRPGAQKPCAGKSRAAPFGMTGWSGARDAQPLQVGLN